MKNFLLKTAVASMMIFETNYISNVEAADMISKCEKTAQFEDSVNGQLVQQAYLKL